MLDKDLEHKLVHRILEGELDAIRVQVEGGLREQVLKSLDERGTAQDLVRQQYSGRYAFELLQNANDAAVDSTGKAVVRFIVTEEALLVANMGQGFRAEEVHAVCSLGRSSKNPRKTIGYKGLGFKSVGEITSRPEIFSPPHAFGFDAERVHALVAELLGGLPAQQHLPIYALPIPADQQDAGHDAGRIGELLAEGFVTVLRLPYRDDMSRTRVADDVARMLRPELLLLLDATDRLELLGTDADFAAERLSETDGDAEQVLLQIDADVQQWVVHRDRYSIPSPELLAPLGGSWSQVSEVSTTVAALLDETGHVACSGPRPLHVYFPLEDSVGTSLLLHADFALDLDRRHLARTPEAAAYNTWLGERLIESTVRAAARLATEHSSGGQLLAALTPRGTTAGPGAVLRQELDKQLSRCPIAMCRDDRVRTPASVQLLPSSLAALSAPERLFDLDRLSAVATLDMGNTATQEWLRTLGATAVQDVKLVDVLRLPPADAEQLYTDLVAWWEASPQRRAIPPALAGTPCVRLAGGGWAAPIDPVFFPRDKTTELDQDLPIAIADVPQIDQLPALLEAAGVRRLMWRPLLTEIVLPWLVSEDTDSLRRQQGMDVLLSYYRSEPRGDQEIRARVRDVLVPVTPSRSTTPTFRQAGRTYFARAWTGNEDLERLYGPFEQAEFLAAPLPDTPAEAQEQREFMTWLGVADKPRLLTAEASTREQYRTGSLHAHPHMRSQRRSFQAWLAQPDVARAAATCDQRHSESQQLTVSHTVDRLPQLLDRCDSATSLLLARLLSKHWTHYQLALRVRFTCTNVQHPNAAPRPVDSLLASLLTERAWLPAELNGKPALKRPSAVWRRNPDLPRQPAATSRCSRLRWTCERDCRPGPTSALSIRRARTPTTWLSYCGNSPLTRTARCSHPAAQRSRSRTGRCGCSTMPCSTLRLPVSSKVRPCRSWPGTRQALPSTTAPTPVTTHCWPPPSLTTSRSCSAIGTLGRCGTGSRCRTSSSW